MIAWLVSNTLVAGALAALLIAAGRYLRLRPALAHLCWLLVFAVLVLPPLPVGVGPGATVARVVHGWLEPPAEPVEPASMLELSGFGHLVALEPVEVAESDADFASTPTVAAPAKVSLWSEIGSLPLSTLLFVLWGSGALAVLVVQLVRVRRFHRRVVSAPLAPQSTVRAVASVARRLGVSVPEIRVVRGIGSPAVWCFGPPRLLWPEGVEPERVPALVAHELAHLARRDHWVARIELVAVSACWWHPLFWFVRRQVNTWAEFACDAWALWAFPERRAFAGALIDAQERVETAPVALQGLGATRADFRNFETRLNMIMKENVSRTVSRTTAGLALLGAVLVAPAFSGGGGGSKASSPSAANAPFRSVEALADSVRLAEKAEKLFHDGEHANAQVLFEKVLEHDPWSGKAHARLGYLLIGQGEYDRAVKHLEGQLAAGHRSAVAAYNLACVGALRGDADLALAWLEKSVTLGFDDHALLASDPDLASVRESARFEKAMKLTEKARFLRGELASAKAAGNHDEAARYRGALLGIVSKDGKMASEHGFDLLKREDLAGAIGAFRQQIKAGFSVANGYYNLACAHARAGEIEPAFDALQNAVVNGMVYGAIVDDPDLEPLRADARYDGLEARISEPGMHYMGVKKAFEKGDLAKAVPGLEAMLESELLTGEVRGWAHYALGSAYHDMARFDVALEHFQRAVNHGHEPAAAAFGMASSLATLGDGGRALAHVRHALDLGYADAAKLEKLLVRFELVPAEKVAGLVERAAEAAKYEKSDWKKKGKIESVNASMDAERGDELASNL